MQFVVYAITNRTNGRVYVGCTAKTRFQPLHGGRFRGLPIRFAEHLSYLMNGEHGNFKLQADWEVGNPYQFSFDVLEELESDTVDDARRAERRWIKAFPDGYNLHAPGRFRRGPNIAEADRREIVKQLRAGHKGKLIARAFGVSRTSVSRIKRELKTYPSINKEKT